MNPDELTSVLFVPGNRPEMFPKAARTDASAICLDLEDAVPLIDAEKASARSAVAGALDRFGSKPLLVRVNPNDSGWLELDLDAVVGKGLAGVVLPKVELTADVERLDYYLTLLERVRGLDPGAIWIVPLIESARGLCDAAELLAVTDRVQAALFGAEDFANDLGIARERGSYQLDLARASFVVACRAAGISPLDGPDPDFRDLDWFAEDSRRSRALGFLGRFCIHPGQIAVANQCYRPAQDEIDRARRILLAYDEAVSTGRGATSLEGRMIDQPVAERARRLLRRAGIAESPTASEGG